MRHFEPDGALRLFGVAADVRRENHVGQVGEAHVELRHSGRRLGGKHVERGAAKVAAGERLAQSVDVHDLAARQVEQIAAGPHARELGAANHGDGARRLGYMERHEVRFVEHVVEVGHRTGETERQLPHDVVEQHAHAKRFGEQAHLLADVAVADEAHGAAAHLVRAGQRFVPVALMQRVALVAQPAGQRDHRADGELGNAAGGGVRRIEHRNAAARRFANGHLVGAHREAADG